MYNPSIRFPTTFWTTLHGQPDRARWQCYVRYWTPVLEFIRRHGFQDHDAEDLAQEVFLRVCREEFLQDADRSKGKFRSLLLAVTRNVILAERKKRAIRKTVPLEEVAAPEEAFEEMWAQNLLKMALKRLEEDAKLHHDAILLSSEHSHEEIARKLGGKTGDVKNWLYQGKKRLKKHLLEIVQSYSSTPGEFAEEVALISRRLTLS